MKIKIGNYPSRLTCDIHTRHMEKKYGFMYADINKAPTPTRFDNFVEGIEGSIKKNTADCVLIDGSEAEDQCTHRQMGYVEHGSYVVSYYLAYACAT